MPLYTEPAATPPPPSLPSPQSGRTSPYFFNAGLFKSGNALGKLGQYYAHAIEASGIPYEVLFGPAYKGIPLVSAIAIALATETQARCPLPPFLSPALGAAVAAES